MITITKSILLTSILLAYSISASAELCKSMTESGEVIFKFAGNKKTNTVCQIVAKIKDCPTPTPVVSEYKIPNPQNACEKSAVLACEPSFGGLPICTTNNFANFCGFCLVTTRATEGMGDVTVRYINGQVYDGSKIKDSVISCPSPALLK